MSNPTIDIVTPTKWQTKAFFAWRKRRAFGVVLAFSPTIFALGCEAITGGSKGFAVMVGPFWLGAATLKIKHQP